ncbi:uncharacterized protein LOC142768586 [Rhipicephalus microplus]|uniref:uncharacterized protein LOC142768586 n=1 Tax=Rhipicephalus microplus TaxID=6941 RepID=UPI003F6AB440
MGRGPCQSHLLVLAVFCLLSTFQEVPTGLPIVKGQAAKDPLYLHPGERGGVWILKRPPGLATIPEEPSSPRSRPDGREQLRRNPRIAGRGGPPITDFLYHPREPFLQGPPAPGLPRGGGPPIGQAHGPPHPAANHGRRPGLRDVMNQVFRRQG